MKPTVISIFSGYGGSSLGYKLAGYKELLAIDFDKNSVETFKLNFPEVSCWQKDIKEVKGEEILKFCKIKKGELDILDGSPPCQGFSTAGKRRLLDSRNDLFLEFVRLIKELQPKVFIMENVSGMVKGKMKGKFIEIMKILKSLNYQVKCKLLNAKYYQVPQSRQRLFFIGVREDLNKKPIFPIPSKRLITVKKAIGYLEEIESKNRKDITIGLKKLAIRLKEGESGSKYHKRKSCFGLIRINRNKPCPTIIKSAGTGLLHYKYNLFFLSVKELQILASFPDSFRFIGNRNEKIYRIGNAVMPNQMKAIAETIRKEILDKL